MSVSVTSVLSRFHISAQKNATVHSVVGASATGLDLVSQLLMQLRKDQTDATSPYTLQSAVLPESKLPPQNQRALALLNAWMSEPDDLGDAWWDEFERDLAKHRLRFRETE